MILNAYVEIIGHPRNLLYYKKLGYKISVGEKIFVDIRHLTKGSIVELDIKCDNCSFTKKLPYKEYYSNTKQLTESYFCQKCKHLKFKKVCLEKYGVDNPMKDNDIKDKLKNTLLEKYGVDHYSKTDEYKEKYKTTCLEKYGVDNASKSQIIKDKISKIKFEEFNTFEKYENEIGDDYIFLGYDKNRNFKLKHKYCGKNFKIFVGTLYDRNRSSSIICTKCNPIDSLSSGGENELKIFLEENNIEFIQNSYSIINPLSIDFNIPKFNLALEFNGVYWHSEVFKNKNYHLNKTQKCSDLGINLIHIWEDDWNLKKNIIKSILLNRFKLIKNKIYARKCEIKIVDTKTSKIFLNSNHIQGYSGSKIRLGLFYKNELVSLMIFGKKRKDIELIRFCNKINFIVIGSASKLFKYFISNYEFSNIVSYSDISMFDGGLYEKLGFKYSHRTPPNYFWVVDGIRKHRFNYNKKNLIKKGYDPNKSGTGIMHELGYHRIWSCGQKKWEFNK